MVEKLSLQKKIEALMPMEALLDSFNGHTIGFTHRLKLKV